MAEATTQILPAARARGGRPPIALIAGLLALAAGVVGVVLFLKRRAGGAASAPAPVPVPGAVPGVVAFPESRLLKKLAGSKWKGVANPRVSPPSPVPIKFTVAKKIVQGVDEDGKPQQTLNVTGTIGDVEARGAFFDKGFLAFSGVARALHGKPSRDGKTITGTARYFKLGPKMLNDVPWTATRTR